MTGAASRARDPGGPAEMPGSAGSATRRYVHSTAQPRSASANAMAARCHGWHRSRSPCGHRPEPGPVNAAGFERPGTGRGERAGAFPQVRLAGLAECGTHALTAATMGACTTGETTLARDLLPALGEGILVLADATVAVAVPAVPPGRS